jgi:hypothetical protein
VKILSYSEDLKIDKYDLENLWEDHQDRYMTYAETYAEAVKNRDEAKEELTFRKAEAYDELERVKAELDQEIRKNYEKYGFVKITDPLVNQWVIVQPQYKQALASYRKIIREYSKKLNTAEYEVNVLDGVKKAFEHRKIAMDNLTRLMLGGYFSGKPSKDVKEIVKEKREQKRDDTMHETIATSLKKRKEKLNG